MSGKNQKNRGTILMRMFYPDRREKSAYTIDYADLYRKGYRGVIFDIDNTLVPHGAPATKEAAAFFASLRETGFSTCLLSTDVYGAKRTGLYNILTEPINPKEEIQIVLKRYLEHIVLFFYERDLARGRITKKNS